MNLNVNVKSVFTIVLDVALLLPKADYSLKKALEL